MKRFVLVALVGLFVFSIGLLGVRVLWLRQAPREAARLIAARKLKDAQQRLETYLEWFGSDARARLLLAEAYGLDDASTTATTEALHHLHLISSSSEVAAEARFREGQLQFLVRHRPALGERLLREALKLQPDLLPANLMLWKLLTMTGRQPESATFFWKACELSHPAEHAVRLREWYLSEFSPGAAAAELDRRWGVLVDDELPSNASELRRYELFMHDEPDAALGFAAAAQLCVRNRELDRAADYLASASKLETAATEPLYFAASINLALEQGEFDKAVDLLGRWPAPRAGYEFYRDQGTILDEVKQDLPAAVKAYRAAIQAETGDAEWTTQNRLAHCLRKLGENAAADAVLKQAKVVERLMEPGVQRPIREGLVHLDDPQQLQPILDLYQSLGRQREVKAWKNVIAALSMTQPRRPAEKPEARRD